jgi:proline iminopeptidase
MATLEGHVLPRMRGRPTTASLATRRSAAIVLALGAAVAAGLLTSSIAPRGPVTSGHALLVIALGVSVGALAGSLVASRWVLVPLFAAYILGVELARLDVVAASLEVRVDTLYGVVALVLTRGLHGLLAFPAMALGVLLAIALARRSGSPSSESRGRRPVGTVLLGLAVAALTVLVAWPASTPPVTGADGSVIPGSIAELASVRLGGQDHTVMIRAADPTKPVLLYLSGGPGQSDLAFSRAFSEGWTSDFVFADLDQRGNGKSYPAIEPLSSMTVDRAVLDVVEVTDYLRTRFDEERIYLMGESWGSLLGVLAVQRRPDLYHAFIGSGQMVNVLETDRRVYRDLLAHAERTADSDLAAALDAVGAPPYRDFPWANSNLLAWYDLIYKPYTPSAGYLARAERAGFVDPFGLTGGEYSLIEKANVLRGLLDTFEVLYPQLYGIDFRRDVPRLEVPYYMLDGAAELEGRRSLALEWYEGLEAPTKQIVTYQDAAHSVAFEQADEVQCLLTETIVPATYGR